MKRRQALLSLLSAASVPALASSSRASQQELSRDAVSEMLSNLGGVTPLPGEDAQARAFLLSFRSRSRIDPRTEPAIRFDPELDT